MKEFELHTGKDTEVFQSRWLEIEDKVLKLAENEDKKKVKSLFKRYLSSKHETTQG